MDTCEYLIDDIDDVIHTIMRLYMDQEDLEIKYKIKKVDEN